MIHFTDRFVRPITDKVIDRWTGNKPNQFAKVIAPHLLLAALTAGAAGAVALCCTPLAVVIPAAIIAVVALGVFCHVKTAEKRAKLDQRAIEMHDPVNKDARFAKAFLELLTEGSGSGYGYGSLFTGIFIDNQSHTPPDFATIVEEQVPGSDPFETTAMRIIGDPSFDEVEDDSDEGDSDEVDGAAQTVGPIPGWPVIDEAQEGKFPGVVRKRGLFDDASFQEAFKDPFFTGTDPFFARPSWFSQKAD